MRLGNDDDQEVATSSATLRHADARARTSETSAVPSRASVADGATDGRDESIWAATAEERRRQIVSEVNAAGSVISESTLDENDGMVPRSRSCKFDYSTLEEDARPSSEIINVQESSVLGSVGDVLYGESRSTSRASRERASVPESSRPDILKAFDRRQPPLADARWNKMVGATSMTKDDPPSNRSASPAPQHNASTNLPIDHNGEPVTLVRNPKTKAQKLLNIIP